MITADELALDLGMLQDDDVRVVVASVVDLDDEEIPDGIAAEVRRVLDPHGERTAPAQLYWPGHVEPGGSLGIGGASPTRGEAEYPE